jgi:Bacterial PH domain
MPPLFLMRVHLDEDGVLVRNYFRAAYVRWDEVAAVTVTRPPIPSPQRRFGCVLAIACRDGRTVTTGSLLNASRQTVAEVAASLERASEKYGFQKPDDLSRLSLAR